MHIFLETLLPYIMSRKHRLACPSLQLNNVTVEVTRGNILVHAFVTSRVDYCNAVLAAAPKTITDRLQRVLNAAAQFVSDTRKFDHGLSRLMHQELHWLDIPERVS